MSSLKMTDDDRKVTLNDMFDALHGEYIIGTTHLKEAAKLSRQMGLLRTGKEIEDIILDLEKSMKKYMKVLNSEHPNKQNK